MRVLTTKFRDVLFATERENIKTFAHDWTAEQAAEHITFDPTLNKGAFSGPHHVTLVDVARRRVCPDAEVPVPRDPLPRVALDGRTLVVDLACKGGAATGGRRPQAAQTPPAGGSGSSYWPAPALSAGATSSGRSSARPPRSIAPSIPGSTPGWRSTARGKPGTGTEPAPAPARSIRRWGTAAAHSQQIAHLCLLDDIIAGDVERRLVKLGRTKADGGIA